MNGAKLNTDRMKRAFSIIKSCPENRIVIDDREERSEINHACLDLDFELIYSLRKYKFEMKTRVIE